MLEHKYTPANLSGANMKGRDRSVVDLLRSIQDEHGDPMYCLSLVLVQRRKTGSVYFDYDCYSRKRNRWGDDSGYDDDGPHEMDEVFDDEVDMSDLIVGPDDTKISGVSVTTRFLESNLLIDAEIGDLFDDDDTPDKQEYEGYTGNAGPTLDYWYYCSAVIICPWKNVGENAKAIGNSVTLSFLRSSISVSQKQVTKQLIDLAVRHCKSNVKHYNWRSDTNELLSTLETAKAVTPILDLMSFISSLNIKGFIVSDSNRLANLYYMSTTKEEKDKILNLARQRFAALQKATENGVPLFSWCQPKAVWNGSGSGVQEFLRSNKKEKIFHHFNDSTHAGNWVSKYFGYRANGTYSATATKVGRSSVKVVKDRSGHDKIVAHFKKCEAKMYLLIATFANDWNSV